MPNFTRVLLLGDDDVLYVDRMQGFPTSSGPVGSIEVCCMSRWHRAFKPRVAWHGTGHRGIRCVAGYLTLSLPSRVGRLDVFRARLGCEVSLRYVGLVKRFRCLRSVAGVTIRDERSPCVFANAWESGDHYEGERLVASCDTALAV